MGQAEVLMISWWSVSIDALTYNKQASKQRKKGKIK
jgi:hypothetical protein